jgi:hypothetical protein
MDAQVAEFGFVESLPKRERSKLGKMIDRYREFKAVANGRMLLPIQAAAALCAVSRQRLWQLVEEGRLEMVTFEGHNYIPEDSLFAWANSERKTGRPSYAGNLTMRDAVEVAKELRVKK